MKKLNLYLISVNLHGPHPYRKSGSGNWVVCETSPENALKVLQKYLSDNNLIGMSGHASLIYKGFPLDTEILPRRHVMQFISIIYKLAKMTQMMTFAIYKLAKVIQIKRLLKNGVYRKILFLICISLLER